ncbi:MAG TPA: glycoside hydrolase family 25 [Candidatus Eisenbergiella merdavium]|uniref:Glycoside hydrolase family 25 n=1 Tax=Candidatus Eisenbergiella merdavium TaxID=2838551 RepID=A0A9D2SR05_9FIRM|nr:glycoside hydrolase family 25 [Candidatus Eisenbergiella merdavium]
MTKKRRHGRHRRREAERMQTAVLAGAAVLLIAVVTVVVLILRCCGGKAETAAREAGAETEASETETEALPESGDGGEAESGTQTAQTEALSGTEGETSVPEESAVKSTVAAEVGSMDDEQDPQSGANAAGTGTGASVDLNTLAKAEGETDEVTLGIDVSKYQGSIDWEQVAQSGVEFAMIRVGYRTKVTGIIYEDPGARYNLQEAAKNGILVGAYFFSSAVSEEEAREEAAWVADFIARYPVTYPVAYNCEDFQSPDSRQYGLGSEERTRIACAFLDTVAAAGYTPMFYASRNEMEGNAQWNMDTLGSRYRVWVSQYPEQPYPETAASTYSGTHAMWQYTSQGTVAGIRGSVDVNLAYFGYSQAAQAKDQTPVEEVAANPELGIEFTEVNDTVTAKELTNLRSLPTTLDSEVIHQLSNGETVQRTGIGSNGWDRVIYNGQKLYAVHNFLTTDLSGASSGAGADSAQESAADGSGDARSDAGNGQGDGGNGQTDAGTSESAGMVFKDVSEAVTARDQVNLRDQPSTVTGNVVGMLNYGEAVVRTGISDSGWSRLEVNGQVVYASSRLLATSMDYKEQEKITDENPEAGMHFTAASGIMMAKSGQTNLRTLPTTNEPSRVVAQLTGDATAERIGEDKDRGWTKLIYNGQTVYAVSSYLTQVG